MTKIEEYEGSDAAASIALTIIAVVIVVVGIHDSARLQQCEYITTMVILTRFKRG